MRVLIFLLVLANLLFYAFSHGLFGSEVSNEAANLQEINPQQVRILSRGEPPAGDAPPADPDERHRIGTVVEFGLHRGIAGFRTGGDAAQPAEHGHLVAATTVGRAMSARRVGGFGHFLRVEPIDIFGKPTAQPAEIP